MYSPLPPQGTCPSLIEMQNPVQFPGLLWERFAGQDNTCTDSPFPSHKSINLFGTPDGFCSYWLDMCSAWWVSCHWQLWSSAPTSDDGIISYFFLLQPCFYRFLCKHLKSHTFAWGSLGCEQHCSANIQCLLVPTTSAEVWLHVSLKTAILPMGILKFAILDICENVEGETSLLLALR